MDDIIKSLGTDKDEWLEDNYIEHADSSLFLFCRGVC